MRSRKGFPESFQLGRQEPGDGLTLCSGRTSPRRGCVSSRRVYLGVLDTIGDLPPVPMVLRRCGGRLHYCPNPRWLLCHFVVRHDGRTLASLSRRYSARAALGPAADAERQDREAARESQQSLPLANAINGVCRVDSRSRPRSSVQRGQRGGACVRRGCGTKHRVGRVPTLLQRDLRKLGADALDRGGGRRQR
jgi:hypothetical protein